MEETVFVIEVLEEEVALLSSKFEALNTFKGSKKWQELTPKHKKLLDKQCYYMGKYIKVLHQRIADLI